MSRVNRTADVGAVWRPSITRIKRPSLNKGPYELRLGLRKMRSRRGVCCRAKDEEDESEQQLKKNAAFTHANWICVPAFQLRSPGPGSLWQRVRVCEQKLLAELLEGISK